MTNGEALAVTVGGTLVGFALGQLFSGVFGLPVVVVIPLVFVACFWIGYRYGRATR